MSARNTTIKRILKEAQELTTNPSPDIHASPLESNLFEWHFTIRGPPSTPFANGIYHGRVILPPAYPLRPPSFRFLTPSGRFEPNREICLSISGHHEETWQPAWGIRTALVAIRAFMDTDAGGQVGGMSASEGTRRELAGKSRGWVCGGCGGRSCEDILREQEVLCKEVGREGAEEENALVGKIGLVDPKKDGSAGGDATSGAVDDSTAVASTSPATLVNAAALPASQQLPTPDPTPTPTRTTPMPTSQTQARPPPAPQRLHTTATDAWIDKAIIGVVIALVLLVLRRMA